VSIGVVGGLVACAAVVWTSYEPQIRKVLGWEEPNDFEGAGSGEVVVMINEGDIGEDIATNLHDAGVTKSFDAFYDLLLAQPTQPEFFPGAYKLKLKMSADSALAALTDEANRMEDTFVIPEGTAEQDALPSIAEGTGIPLEELQAAAADVASFGLPAEATSLEGFLFPATYSLPDGGDAHAVLQTLVNRSFQALDDAGVKPEDRWKTIVLASLIQKEAGLRDDYYKVSRVFLNRLDPSQWESGLLQSDATVAYGTGNTHRVSTTDAEREDASCVRSPTRGTWRSTRRCTRRTGPGSTSSPGTSIPARPSSPPPRRSTRRRSPSGCLGWTNTPSTSSGRAGHHAWDGSD
jgi:UPF0755 protein